MTNNSLIYLRNLLIISVLPDILSESSLAIIYCTLLSDIAIFLEISCEYLAIKISDKSVSDLAGKNYYCRVFTLLLKSVTRLAILLSSKESLEISFIFLYNRENL